MTTNMDDLVGTYIKLREKKAIIKSEYEQAVAKYDAIQEKIEALIMQRFNEMGVESIRTAAGTAYASKRVSVSLADWDVFREFCKTQDDPYTFMDRRVSKAAVEQYKAEHDDLPPGVNWSETRIINFRRS